MCTTARMEMERKAIKRNGGIHKQWMGAGNRCSAAVHNMHWHCWRRGLCCLTPLPEPHSGTFRCARRLDAPAKQMRSGSHLSTRLLRLPPLENVLLPVKVFWEQLRLTPEMPLLTWSPFLLPCPVSVPVSVHKSKLSRCGTIWRTQKRKTCPSKNGMVLFFFFLNGTL